MKARRWLLTIALVAVWAGWAQARQDDPAAALLGLARVKRDAGDNGSARRFFEEARRTRALTHGEETEYFWVLAEVDQTAAVWLGRELLTRKPSDDVREKTLALAASIGDETSVVRLATEGQRLSRSAKWSRYLAENYVRSGKTVEAVAAYRATVAATDSTIEDRAGLAFALEASAAHAEALGAWNTLSAGSHQSHPEWARSRLRVLAAAAASPAASEELERWIAAHPDDLAMRETLVELWARLRQPSKALAATGPLTSGPHASRWLRREVDLARQSGDLDRALLRLEALQMRGLSSAADEWDIADLLLTTKRYDRATKAIAALAPRVKGCHERLLAMIDRLPEPGGTNLLVDEVSARSCTDNPAWIVRSIDRSVAAGRHQDALRAMETLPLVERNERQRLYGQLLLWTGNTSRAIDTLRATVEHGPRDLEARLSLVDAYRSAGRAYEAWTVAEPVTSQPLPDERLLMLAELALEADHPHSARAILDRIRTESRGVAATILSGLALAALGHPAEAKAELSAVNASELSPAGALTLIDSTIALDGWESGWRTAGLFTQATSDWRDVLTRRLVIALVTNRADAAATLRATLARQDVQLSYIAEAEAALATERPHDAIEALRRVAPDAHADRVDDLRATALAGIGQLREASDATGQLVRTRPYAAIRRARSAQLSWQLDASDVNLNRLLAINATSEGNVEIAIMAAEALTRAGRAREAVETLSAYEDALPVNGRIVLARALRATGDPRGALSILEDVPELTGRAAILCGELVNTVRGTSAAFDYFQLRTADANASADLFLAWAAVASSEAERARVLEAGVSRFPERGDLLVRLARSALAAGNATRAAAHAERAVALNPRDADSWFALIDATSTSNPAALATLIDRFSPVVISSPALAVGAAEHVAGLSRSPGDPLIATALKWLEHAPDDGEIGLARALARARILAIAERWPEALATVDSAVALDPGALLPLRLRADVLSWAGEHDAALDAFDVYLSLSPRDLDARRQQARVAGWAGARARAARLYASLREEFPDVEVVRAEADAKTSFLNGRWRAAAAAYERWLVLEPTNTEARFELAESQRAAGHVEHADTTLETLAASSGHRLAAAARERSSVNRRPSVAVVERHRSAVGYADERLLDVTERGGSAAVTLGRAARTALSADAVRVLADGAVERRTGSRAGVALLHRFTTALDLDAKADWWRIGDGRPSITGSLRATLRPGEQWLVSAGVERSLFIENISTLDDRLTTFGAFATFALDTPGLSLNVQGRRETLSDGNARDRVSLSLGRPLSQKLSHIRLLAWSDLLSYRSDAADYFAPRHFVRADAGASYTLQFVRPRFRGDRQRDVVFSYLVGTDNRETLYHHPSAHLAFELASGLAIDTRADWIRSTTYDETTFSLAVRIGGSPGRR